MKDKAGIALREVVSTAKLIEEVVGKLKQFRIGLLGNEYVSIDEMVDEINEMLYLLTDGER